ncbi:hypothetical protein AGDE_13885 [Angomonas deanei]|nr:hypothetical protein AGDE_13885 [Angomonas deanei]|eukprot:EPY21667.1 hypothetical protein AGDE_13885 [Angomonas deanei]
MFEATAAAALEDSDPFFFHHVQDPNDSNHSHPNHSHSAGASGSTLPASSSPFHAFEHETGVLRGLAPHHRSSSCGASGDFTREAASSHRHPMRRSESLTNLKIETNFNENTSPGKAILHSEEKGRGMEAAGTGKAKKKVQVCEPTAAEGKSDLEMENSSESSSGDNYNNVYLPPSSAAMNSDAQDSDADFYKIFAGGVHAETGLYVEEDERPVPASGMMRGNGPYRRPPPLRTRNVNALRAFIWDQRVFLPVTRGWLSDLFTLFASPRFLEKCDWAFRGSVLCILPPLILCLEPSTRGIFPLPTSVVAYAFWISGPTFGQVLKELYLCLKGFSISLTIMCVFISNPAGSHVAVPAALFHYNCHCRLYRRGHAPYVCLHYFLPRDAVHS